MDIVNRHMKPSNKLVESLSKVRFERNRGGRWEEAGEDTQQNFMSTTRAYLRDIVMHDYNIVRVSDETD